VEHSASIFEAEISTLEVDKACSTELSPSAYMTKRCHNQDDQNLHLPEFLFVFLPNPSSRTMALGSTQPLTEMSTRILRAGKADNLTASVSRLSGQNVGASTSHNPMGLHSLLQV
jgi:hypothetical protein